VGPAASGRMPKKRNQRLHIPRPKRLNSPSYELLRIEMLIRAARSESNLLPYRCKRHLRLIPLTLCNNGCLRENPNAGATLSVTASK
jgi:hypothetical protein